MKLEYFLYIIYNESEETKINVIKFIELLNSGCKICFSFVFEETYYYVMERTILVSKKAREVN